MNWLRKMVRRGVRLTIAAMVFFVAVIVLDAALSPDGPENPR